mgnify:CR=1 FL=1
MQKAIVKSILIFALVLILGFLVFYNLRRASNPAQEGAATASVQQKLEQKTDVQANVTVVVTPVDILSQSKEWKFDIVIDTHSVELGQDMAKIAILIDEEGKEYKPARWEGAPASGHHRGGVLAFARITPAPKSVELKIIGIADTVRTFTWQLNK